MFSRRGGYLCWRVPGAAAVREEHLHRQADALGWSDVQASEYLNTVYYAYHILKPLVGNTVHKACTSSRSALKTYMMHTSMAPFSMTTSKEPSSNARSSMSATCSTKEVLFSTLRSFCCERVDAATAHDCPWVPRDSSLFAHVFASSRHQCRGREAAPAACAAA